MIRVVGVNYKIMDSINIQWCLYIINIGQCVILLNNLYYNIIFIVPRQISEY